MRVSRAPHACLPACLARWCCRWTLPARSRSGCASWPAARGPSPPWVLPPATSRRTRAPRTSSSPTARSSASTSPAAPPPPRSSSPPPPPPPPPPPRSTRPATTCPPATSTTSTSTVRTHNPFTVKPLLSHASLPSLVLVHVVINGCMDGGGVLHTRTCGQTGGVSHITAKCIEMCDRDLQPDLLKNIVLAGASVILPGSRSGRLALSRHHHSPCSTHMRRKED